MADKEMKDEEELFEEYALEDGILYTLEDEEGNEQEFELLGELEYNGAEYCALIPYYEDGEDMLKDKGEFIVLKRETIDGEEMLCTIEDESELDTVGAMFIEQFNAFFDAEEEEDA